MFPRLLQPLLLLVVLLLGATIGGVNADLHFFGDKRYAQLELARQLYNASGPDATARNYTVVFKLRDAASKSYVTYVELRVPGVNTSALMGDVRYDRSAEHTMEVTLIVPNARNLSLHLSVYTTHASRQDMQFLLDSSLDKLTDKQAELYFKRNKISSQLQSFTMVHVQRPPPPPLEVANATETMTTMSGPYNAIGRRQPGDRLVHFRTMTVTNLNNFPSREILFEGNERLAISYVGFAFDSPTAVAFLNSSHIGERQVSAIVYDMSAPAFIANMSVFGYEWSWFEQKPLNYQPILRLGYTASRQRDEHNEATGQTTANATETTTPKAMETTTTTSAMTPATTPATTATEMMTATATETTTAAAATSVMNSQSIAI